MHTDPMTGWNFPDPTLLAWDAHAGQWQAVLNELPIPPRHLQHDCNIRVQARIVWERDGLEVRDTIAYAWFGRKVLVEVRDHRRYVHGVWLHASDVRRR